MTKSVMRVRRNTFQSVSTRTMRSQMRQKLSLKDRLSRASRLSAGRPNLKSLPWMHGNPLNVLLKLYNYPAWKVDINGKAMTVRGRPKTGQIVIPVSSGESVISVTLARTWDRIVGIVISLLAAAAVLAFALRQTRRELLPL